MKNILKFLGFGLIMFIFVGCGKPLPVQSLYPGDIEMWDHILTLEEGEAQVFEKAPLAAILPHHMIASGNLSKFYAGLSAVSDPSVVFVIGPNHYEKGEAKIQTCMQCVFETTKGNLEIENDLVDDMVDDKVASYFDELFVDEHSIFTHATFIKNYFPNAEIVPITLKWNTPKEELDALVEWINARLYSDTLVIGSVDFSHYQPPGVADFHDQSSFTTIKNFDYDNLYDLEIDSPASVYTVMKLMEAREYMNAERLDHSNLYQFVTDYTDETTSHQYWAFFEGESQPSPGVSILSFGNFIQDESLVFGNNWRWDPGYDEGADLALTKYLRDLRGVEDRFFVGTDYLVFDLKDNGCLYEEQTGMGVSFCKFVEGYEDPAADMDMYDIVEAAGSESDLVYVLYEFDGGNLTKSRQEVAALLIQSGADIFVGRGLNDGVLPVKSYKGGLIFYSLGDFITDSKLATELGNSSSGAVVGLYATPDVYEVYFFPISVVNGYPKLLDQSLRTQGFLEFAGGGKWSRGADMDPSKGVLKIKR